MKLLQLTILKRVSILDDMVEVNPIEANMNSTLGDLKHLIQQLSIRDRWVLLKWLVEWLQQESHIYAEPEEATFLDLIAQS